MSDNLWHPIIHMDKIGMDEIQSNEKLKNLSSYPAFWTWIGPGQIQIWPAPIGWEIDLAFREPPKR